MHILVISSHKRYLLIEEKFCTDLYLYITSASSGQKPVGPLNLLFESHLCTWELTTV